jgi:putative oxidoreductase
MADSQIKRNLYLQIGGMFSFAFAIFQISAIFWSKELLMYFGGPVKMQAENPFMYIFACLFVGALVAACGLYAFSGAGRVRRFPLLRTMLITITTIYMLRGLAIITDLIIIHNHPELNLWRFFFYSCIALCIGLAHLVGVIKFFKYGRPEIHTGE